MRIDIIDVAGNITQEKVKGKTVIIIDVLRATSVMTTALANGVKAIYPYKDIESVLKNSKLDKNPLLCGERKGLKIEGFDCGNSPLEYPRELVEGRNMYMTTSNGTRAIGLKFIAENSKDIPTTLKGTKHYEYLKSIGFTGDMEHCFTMDKYDILPFYKDGKIIVKE